MGDMLVGWSAPFGRLACPALLESQRAVQCEPPDPVRRCALAGLALAGLAAGLALEEFSLAEGFGESAG